MGAQWFSGRVLDSRPRGHWLEPHQRLCVVSLSKNINPSLVLVQPRKIGPYITERLLIGHKESNQTKLQFNKECLYINLISLRTKVSTASPYGFWYNIVVFSRVTILMNLWIISCKLNVQSVCICIGPVKQKKIAINFLSISLNVCFGCSKEPSLRDGSFEYPQHMFWLRNKKNNFELRSLIWGPVYVSKIFILQCYIIDC